MKRILVTLAAVLCTAHAAPNSALVNSWFLSGQGQNAQVFTAVSGGTTTGPSTTWSGQTTAVLGDVQKVQSATASSFVYVSVPELASYVMGPFWGNAAKTQPFVNMPKAQSGLFKVAYTSTYPSASHGTAGNGPVGLLVNGVVIYNAGDAFAYSHSTSADANPGDGIWNRMAQAVEATTFDHALAHQPGNGQYHNHVNPTALRAQLNDNVDYVGTTNFFPYDPAAYWLTHGTGADGTYAERTTNLHHSPIVGWMFDGYPIYGPYGYSTATDPNSAVTRMRSSYSLRTDITTGSARIAIPGWSAVLDTAKLASAGTAPGALYTMNTAEQALYAGPNVSATFPLGRYGEDFAFISGSGDLDQWNGRWCVTPEFPGGTYAYFITIDATGAPAFPYIVNRQYYGPNNGSGAATLSESVTIAFDVTTNVAPVVVGPATGSVAQGGTFAFTGANLFSVSDKDAAAMESVTITASAGTVSLDRSGILASQTVIVAGANGSTTVTLSGAISQLNAAVATLTFTAPASGSSAAVSVQANDGSTSNNLSNTVSAAITLTSTNTPPTISSISAATVVKNNATSAIAFSVSDAETAAASLTVSATSSNTTLVPNANISFGGSGANRTVTVTPVLGQIGTATITVTVSDGTSTTSTTFTVTVQPPNILLIIADDLGLDALSLYSDVLGNSATGQFPPTPTIASLASAGVRFNHAYTYTVCSPSRSSILTGRFGYRTGIGNVVSSASNNLLQATEFTLPDAFAANSTLGYQLKHIGKWHLTAISGTNANLGPCLIGGWPAFSGSLPGQLSDFYNWTKVISDGTQAGTSSSTVTTYATTDQVNDAVAFINSQTTAGKPWFTTVAFNAPHITQASPWYQLPPTSLLTAPYNALSGTTADILANPRTYFDATIQAMDTEMARLLASVDLNKTDVIFVGDNGTYGANGANSGSVIQSPFSASHGKASLYEGGIRVPLIIRGPDVVSPGRSTDVLTHFVDLYSTILEMAGINVAATVPSGTAIDSHSLLPVLQNTATTQSSLIYGEEFDIQFPTLGGRCLRDSQYKLIRNATGVNQTSDEFYDLLADPYEATNLIASGTGSLTAPQLTAYNNLVTQLGTFNTPPTISAIANQSVAIDTATSAIPVTVGDAEMSPAILTVTGASSNTTLVPTANVILGGSGANRTVTVTPASGQTGVSTITISVTDGAFTANSSFTVTVGSVTVVGTPSISPASPTNTDPVVVSANVTPAAGRTITGVSLQYNSSTPATATVFYETMASAAIASPWTGTGTNAAWTVIPATGAPYSQTAAANNTPIAIANPSFGMELNGGAPPPLGNNTRITTTNTINAATISGNATTSGYVEFSIMTANLSGTMGWDFQTTTDGSTFTSRVVETSGSNHAYQLYHYNLTAAELKSTLQLRFRFAGTGPTGTTISKFSLDDIKVVTSTATSPVTIAMTGPSGGGVWTTTIPAQAAGTVLNYTITATDSASATATNTGSYTVVAAAPVLAVTPSTALSSSGAAAGGIYTPSSIAYTLTNSGTGTMNWTAAKTQSWLDLSATGGTLAASASTTVTASINVANANALSANTYNDTITFTNGYNGTGNTTRGASLLVTNGTPTAPAPPVLSTLPLFSAGTSKTILWPAVATATSYTLQIASSANFTTNLLSTQTVSTPYATFTNLADGVTYYYRVLATNSVGSSAYSNTVFTTQDTIPPVVAITSPARGTMTASNTITVTGTASDTRSGISGVTVNNVAATSTTGSTFATWTATVPLGFGTNVITATATDGAGNQATTFATSLTSAVTVTMTTPQTYNPLIIPDTITGTTFNLDLYQVNKQFPTWSATNPTLGINPSTTLGGAPGTTTLGYNGALMWGPTLIMNKGDTVQMNVANHLDQSSSTLLRSTTTTVHWHGLHIPAIMDGGPRQVVAAGTTWSPTFTVMNNAATYWYHPHLHMATQEQLTLGAGGFIIVRDPNEAALNLPRTYGVDDIPLAVTTRRLLSGNNEFSANQYVQSDSSTSSTDNYGDYVLVNGTMNPQVSLPQQYVRLRILCADIQRGYRIGFSDNRNFYVIANDQGLLNAPQLVSQVTMMIGERVEILVDLSNDSIGSSLDLMAWDNLGTAGALSGSLGGFGGSESNSSAPNGNVGRENGGLLCNSDFKLVHINVAAATANAVTSVPATLANYTYWTDGQQTNTRVINIANGNGGTPGFTFDSIAYSPTYNNFNIPLNAIEEWKINGGQVFGHSLHIHDIKFKIVARGTTNIQAANGVITGNTNQIFDTVNNNGGVLIGSKACANYESGWKDTVYVPRGETVWVVAKYDDFASPTNPYMLHCHMLNHEDGGLMGQFVVTSAATDAIAVASVTRTGSNSVINFQFNTTPGTSFLVQYSPDMTTGSWTTIGTTTGNSDGSGAIFTEVDAGRLAQARGFYRAVLQSVVTPPAITSPATATATHGVFSSNIYTVTATNSPTGFSAILDNVTGTPPNLTHAPGGLTVNPNTGVISGTPTTAGTYNISVSASNSGGTTHATIVLTVN